jgi:hypothetical protein
VLRRFFFGMLNFFKFFRRSFLFLVLYPIFVAMKIIAQILMFVFIAFLLTPTVVSLIEKDADISVFYSLSEEEHSQKEVKAIFNYTTSFEVATVLSAETSLILSENLSKHDNIASSIFIPPPDQV